MKMCSVSRHGLITVNFAGVPTSIWTAVRSLSLQDVDVYIPHQANLRIMTMVAKKLGIPDERMIKTVSEQGNTSAASVPLALDEAVRSGKISDGSLVLLQAVGAGMAWGSAIVRWRSE